MHDMHARRWRMRALLSPQRVLRQRRADVRRGMAVARASAAKSTGGVSARGQRVQRQRGRHAARDGSVNQGRALRASSAVFARYATKAVAEGEEERRR